MAIMVHAPVPWVSVSRSRMWLAFGVVCGLFWFPLAGRSSGQVPPARNENAGDAHSALWRKNALGGQLGPWFSSNLSSTFSDTDARLTANSTAFHMEFFYQPHLAGIVNLDLNAGAVGRGEMRISTGTVSSYGTATIYPIGFGVRLAPFAKSSRWPLQPMIRLGGTMLIGTEQFETALTFSNGTYVGTSTRSRWAIGFYGGAGFAWVAGERIALTACVKYQHARFTNEVFGSKDYSGIQVLVGVMYLYFSDARKGFRH